MHELEKNIADFFPANNLSCCENYLIAASGGADSTALMHALKALQDNNSLSSQIICAHINHHLRGEDADHDQKFVKTQAKNLNFHYQTKDIDVKTFAKENKLSIETAARRLRIDTLIAIAKENNSPVVLTAHHADDNAETVILRLLRGTGFKGLAGIWPVRSFGNIKFASPMLEVTRRDIIQYLSQNNIPWRQDKTNADTNFKRNFVRHTLLSQLAQNSTGPLTEKLSCLAHAAKGYQKILTAAAAKLTGCLTCDSKGVSLNFEKICNEPPDVQYELLRVALTKLKGVASNLTQTHLDAILKLAQSNQSGKAILLPENINARFEYGRLIFRKNPATIPDSTKPAELNIPGETTFADFTIDAQILDIQSCSLDKFKKNKDQFTEWLDLDKIKGQVSIRRRKPGDRFIPIGHTSPQRIGKFITAQKLPACLREKLLILEDSKNILWLAPVRPSESAKITSKTTRVLQLKLTQKS